MTSRRSVTPTAYLACAADLQFTDRAAWLALRSEGIGGSDIAAIMRLDVTRDGNPRRTPWEVYLDKAGELPPWEPDQRAEEMMWFGHAMEAVAAERFQMQNPGMRLTRLGMLARKDLPWMRVNVDRRVLGCPDGPCGWECKNSSQWLAADWSLSSLDGVPDRAAIQAHWGMMITGWSHWHLTTVIGGNELRTYRIQADPSLHEIIMGEASWFWNEHVTPRVPPPLGASERTGDILARLWDATPDAIREVTPEVLGLMERLQAAEAQAASSARQVADAEHELQAWLEDDEIAIDPETGKPLFTWKRNGTFASARFRQEADPALVARYTVQKDAIDTGRLAENDPDTYRRYRGRVFRTKREGS